MIKVVTFDTETTGLINPQANELEAQPEIIELYMAKYALDEEGEWHFMGEIDTFLRPKKPVSDEITKITGITQNMVVGAPTFADKYEEIANFMVGATHFTAHNLAFDRNMMANELLRLDRLLQFPWPPGHICTVRASKHYEGYRLNLTKLHEFLFGEGFPGAHRAKNDVIPQWRCFKEMVVRGDIKL